MGLSVLFFAAHLAAESESPEIKGDQEYVGNFIGLSGNKIHIELARTGYRVSLPLAADVEYLHKDSGYIPYDPENMLSELPVKAIEVDGRIVQVIMLWEIPR